MIVHTDRLVLRPVHRDDLDAVWAIHGDPETNRYNPTGPLPSRAVAEDLLRQWDVHWRDHGFGYWAIAAREQPETVIGFGGVRFRDLRGAQRLNLYFRFAPPAWGKGHATEMGRAAVALAFGELDHDAVFATTLPENQPSIAVLERLGFQRDGEHTDRGRPSNLYVRHRA
ncbi:MAG TPA: GNAT family N-acetyltransferase [Kofleriaceae bacterium]|jgi:RimJ/RimL family protein N-acetyltransferase|nr:GNAT family N-acetyltransferase [Kofleriaceae bacterium]